MAALICPRPLQVVHGRKDPLFPIGEGERAVSKIQQIYGTTGTAASFEHAWGSADHRFHEVLMWPFIERLMKQAGGAAGPTPE